MLLHILTHNLSHSEPLLPLIMAELKSALLPSSTPSNPQFDIQKLVQLPLLNAAFSETQRLYIDFLITRSIYTDTVLDKYLLRPGEMVMVPSVLINQDPEFWGQYRRNEPLKSQSENAQWRGSSNSPADRWDPTRFLTTNSAGNIIYSAADTQGHFAPWGGGRHMCPGRVFAKQEVFGAIAEILSAFEIEPIGYVEGKGVNEADLMRNKKRGDGLLQKASASLKGLLGPNRKPVRVCYNPDVPGFPGLRPDYSGTGTVGMDGDMRVRLRNRLTADSG